MNHRDRTASMAQRRSPAERGNANRETSRPREEDNLKGRAPPRSGHGLARGRRDGRSQNRRRAAGRAALKRSQKKGRKSEIAPDEADGEALRLKLRSWEEFEANGFLR
jgi:hypothetical protein